MILRLKALLKYRFLLWEFVKRDIKKKYRRSVLGLFWTLLDPVLNMLVMTILFSTFFRNSIEHFPVYLLTANTIFRFFSETSNNAMHSVIGGSALIKKVYMPKYLLPLSKVCSGGITLFASILALFAVMAITGVAFKPTLLLLVFPVMYIALFSFGIGLFLSSVALFFNDIVHLYGVIVMLLGYLSAQFYPLGMLTGVGRSIVIHNPMTNIIQFTRMLVLEGQVPPIELHLICIIPGVMAIVFGMWFFYRTQNKFILHM